MSGKHDGKQAVPGALGSISDSFDNYRVSPDEMVEERDMIVVLSHIEGTSKSGNEIKAPGVEVWEMSDGITQRVPSLIDTAEMKAAMGG